MPDLQNNAVLRARESLGQRIRRIRKQRRLTQNELAERAGINQGYLSAIERDQRDPSMRTLDALAVALDAPQAVLIGAGPEHDAPQPLETREVPLLGSIPAGKPSQSQAQLEMFPVLRHLWAADRYCLKLSFDSMEPTLKPDDIVLVHYRPDADPEHVQGRICACLVDGNPTLKRVSVEHRGPRQVVILRGDNPAAPPMTVDEGSEFSIQGIVVKLVSRDL
ncbi:MAG: LexA family transcriptional regulator [Phycisphaerae bacterium]